MTGEVVAGRYRLLHQLGHGAMSAVWCAHDDELDRDVALKLLAPTADRERFQREARAVAALSHPNICNLYDYGESDGKPYMVLEYLPGGTLEDLLRRGPLPDDQAERYATEIAAGLAHAHANGVVHRDLKPANVLFDSEGRAKIADFGIARMGDDGTLTEAGTVLGTAAYISPEQASGLPATPASDVYSFGAIVFRMLTGRLPFVADNAMELVRMNRDDPPPAVADVRRDAPPLLAATADAALRKDPAARPADGAALLAALHDESPTQVIRRPAPRRRIAWAPAVVVLALVLLFGGVALALALNGVGGSGGDGTDTPPASISIPKVPTVSTAGTTQPETTSAAATTAAETTTASTSTAAATTTAPPTTSTHRTTTAHTTTARTTTAAPPTTTAPPPPVTTYDTTTYDTTTYDTTSYDTTTTGP